MKSADKAQTKALIGKAINQSREANKQLETQTKTEKEIKDLREQIRNKVREESIMTAVQEKAEVVNAKRLLGKSPW